MRRVLLERVLLLINPQETDLMSQLDAVTTKDNDDKKDEND